MGLVVKQTMQQLISLVTFLQVRRLQSQEYRHRACLIFYIITVLFLLLLLLIARQLSNLIIRYYRYSSNLSFLNSLSLALSERYVHPQQCSIVHLRRELIIIGWAFMHQLNISPLLSLARFFLTQQLIYKRKTEKHNVSLDIFVSDTSIDRNLYLSGKRTFQLHTDPYSFLCDQISVFVLLKNKDHL